MVVQLYNSHQAVFQDSIKYWNLGGDHGPHLHQFIQKSIDQETNLPDIMTSDDPFQWESLH